MCHQPSISKAIRGVQGLGLTITGAEIGPDGTIRVLTGAHASGSDSELEAARERRRARKIDRTA